MKLDDRLRAVQLILCDVDGVLTDGGIVLDNEGIETKTFHIRDGFGIKLWRRAGYQFGILTSRSSHIVKVRSAELDLDVVRQGCEDKLPAAQEIIENAGVAASQVCYIGDDLPDLPVMRYVGVGAAVADAAGEVRDAADLVTTLPGGRGAVREVVELLLKAKMRWDELIHKYTAGHRT